MSVLAKVKLEDFSLGDVSTLVLRNFLNIHPIMEIFAYLNDS